MKSINPIKTITSIGLCIAFLFGAAAAAGADDGRVIARCSLVENELVKTVHYKFKARNLHWQVNKNAKRYPWVQAMLEHNPAGDVLPATQPAKADRTPQTEKAVLATMHFVTADDRPFSTGKAALGDIALAVYPAAEKPIRNALVKKNGKLLITRKQTPDRPTVHITHNLDR
jgi:hypothetical protein